MAVANPMHEGCVSLQLKQSRPQRDISLFVESVHASCTEGVSSVCVCMCMHALCTKGAESNGTEHGRTKV